MMLTADVDADGNDDVVDILIVFFVDIINVIMQLSPDNIQLKPGSLTCRKINPK